MRDSAVVMPEGGEARKPRNWPYGPFARKRPDVGPGVVEVAMRNGDRHYGRGWLPAVVVRAYWRRFKRVHHV